MPARHPTQCYNFNTGTEIAMETEGGRALTDRELLTLKEFVENTLRKSGSILMERYGKGDVAQKFDESLVTQAENEAWGVIHSKIGATFDGHAFLKDLSEEVLNSESCPRFVWIVDALDGAASFQAGMPVWGISAALFEKFWPVLAFLYLPATGELYSAFASREAYLNDKAIRVRQDPTVDNESLVLVYSRFHNDFQSNFPGKIRNFGSSSGHMAYVARGVADACLLQNVSVRDMAAGSIILEAAGGEIRFLDGRPFHVGDYLVANRVEEPLIAAPKDAFESIVKYFRKQ
ncbi:MAG: inositol monophosphatase family protein [Thermodesulfobacteriota bacterium]